MRLFAAINFDRNMNDALLSVQEQFRENNVKGNYTRAENLHLTLAFIGEYNDPDYVLDTLSAMHFSPLPPHILEQDSTRNPLKRT